MSWTTNPSQEQLINWYADLFKLSQVPAAERLLKPHVQDFRNLSFKEAKELLGKMWRSMRDEYSSKFSAEFAFVHRLTSKGLAATHFAGGPFLQAGPVDPQ